MIDLTAVLVAVKATLDADPVLSSMATVYQLRIPATHDWAKVALEMGEQSVVRDEAGSYASWGDDILLRLMGHSRGEAPGVGSMDAVRAALLQADARLTLNPVTAAGTWYFSRDSGLPATMDDDDEGYPRPAAGTLYRIRAG